jgi:hypothetical protein
MLNNNSFSLKHGWSYHWTQLRYLESVEYKSFFDSFVSKRLKAFIDKGCDIWVKFPQYRNKR